MASCCTGNKQKGLDGVFALSLRAVVGSDREHLLACFQSGGSSLSVASFFWIGSKQRGLGGFL